MFTSKVWVLVCCLFVVSPAAQRASAAPGFASSASASASDLGMDSYWPRALHEGESFALETPPAAPSVELLAPLPPAAREIASSEDQATDHFEQETTDQEPDYPAGFTLKSIEEIIYNPDESEGDSLPPTSDEDVAVAGADADADNEILTDPKAGVGHIGYEPRRVEGDQRPPSDYYYDYSRANDWFMRYLMKVYGHTFAHDAKDRTRMPGTGKDSEVLAWQRVRREAAPASEYSANSGDATGSYSGASAFAGSGSAQDLSRISFPGYAGVPEFPVFPGSDFPSFGDNPEGFGSNSQLFAAGMLSQDQQQGYGANSPDIYSPPQFGSDDHPVGLQSRIGGGGETEGESGAGPVTGISASIEGRSKGSFASSSSSDDGSGKKTLSVRTGHF